jgi:hypothetical protein
MEYNNRIVSLNKCSIFLLAVLIFIVPVSATPSINISDGQISDIGGTTTLNLTLSGISNGICGYNITISLSNPGVPEIVSVEFPAWANLSNSSSLPSDSIWIKALDTKNETTFGNTNVLLATLTVRGDSQGSTEVIPTVNGLDDDNGSIITPTPIPGRVDVGKVDFILSLASGWNMVSIPIIPDNTTINHIFGQISTLNIRPVVTWQSPLFVPVNEVQAKIGYWVFTPSPINIEIIGTPITDKKLSLVSGWNMIGTTGLGNLDLTKIPNQVSQRLPVTWQSPIFTPIDQLVPGKAGWVFVTQTTEVEI